MEKTKRRFSWAPFPLSPLASDVSDWPLLPQITYDDRAREMKEEKSAPPPAVKPAAVPADDEHGDIDIDDI